MGHGRIDLPLFYLLSEDDWPKFRRGPSFLAAMRDAAQRRFRDPQWQKLASTYRFGIPLPPTNSMEPDDQAEVTRILEWHHPDVHIDRHHVNDMDEDAPSGVLVRYWTAYDLDDADWHRAREIETQCRARTDVQLREFDGLLNDFARATIDGTVATFTVNERDGTTLSIAPEFWDVDLPVLRARHAHGRYDPDNAGSRSPHGRGAIFVEPTGLETWLGGIKPILFDAPPDLALARTFLDDLEVELRRASHERQKREGIEEGEVGIPGGRNALSATLKSPPFNLTKKDCDMLIGERSTQVFKKKGRPGDSKMVRPILDGLLVKYVSPI